MPDGLAGVVVVDNASRDETTALVDDRTALMRNDINQGFGAACNQGRSMLGDVDYLLFLNPDAALAELDLARLCDYLAENPSCGLVGPRLYQGDTGLTSAGRRASLWSELRLVLPPRVGRALPERRLPADYSTNGPVGYVEGACMLFRAKAFDLAGGFDPGFFLFFEEQDLSDALRSEGFTVDLCADASARHTRAVSRRTLPDAGRSELLRSAARYLRKRHGVLSSTIFRAVGLMHVLERLARRKITRDIAALYLRSLLGLQSHLRSNGTRA